MACNEIDRIIGFNLNQKRTMKGISQQAMASACQPAMKAQQISKFELGINRISSSQLFIFAKIIGCPVTDLFQGVDGELSANDIFSGEDLRLMKNYKILSEKMQDSVRVLISAMVKELAAKYRDITT